MLSGCLFDDFLFLIMGRNSSSVIDVSSSIHFGFKLDLNNSRKIDLMHLTYAVILQRSFSLDIQSLYHEVCILFVRKCGFITTDKISFSARNFSLKILSDLFLNSTIWNKCALSTMKIVFLSSTIWNKYELSMLSLTKRNQLFITIYVQQNYQTSFSFAWSHNFLQIIYKPQ
jgi:hypothetical protein